MNQNNYHTLSPRTFNAFWNFYYYIVVFVNVHINNWTFFKMSYSNFFDKYFWHLNKSITDSFVLMFARIRCQILFTINVLVNWINFFEKIKKNFKTTFFLFYYWSNIFCEWHHVPENITTCPLRFLSLCKKD